MLDALLRFNVDNCPGIYREIQGDYRVKGDLDNGENN